MALCGDCVHGRGLTDDRGRPASVGAAELSRSSGCSVCRDSVPGHRDYRGRNSGCMAPQHVGRAVVLSCQFLYRSDVFFGTVENE